MGSISMRLPSPKGAAFDEAFWYPLNPATLNANQAGVQAQLQLDTDSDFVWEEIWATWTFGALGPSWSMTLVDMSRARPIIGSADGQAVLAPNLTGVYSGGQLFLSVDLPKPFRLKGGTQLIGVFNNLLAQANTIQFSLIGRKVFAQ